MKPIILTTSVRAAQINHFRIKIAIKNVTQWKIDAFKQKTNGSGKNFVKIFFMNIFPEKNSSHFRRSKISEKMRLTSSQIFSRFSPEVLRNETRCFFKRDKFRSRRQPSTWHIVSDKRNFWLFKNESKCRRRCHRHESRSRISPSYRHYCVKEPQTKKNCGERTNKNLLPLSPSHEKILLRQTF